MQLNSKRTMLAAVLLAACAGSAAAADKGHGAHWTYEGAGGPANWGDLAPEFKACKAGTGQTPIDLGASAVAGRVAPIAFDYKSAPLRVLNNGHTVQVNYPQGSSMSVAGKTYQLVQFHFHAPSEHTVNGKPYDMELHFVHKDAEGKLGVVGVFLNKGKANGAIRSVWDNMPRTANTEKVADQVQIDANALLPRNAAYYHYSGSLTTPPCSEGVSWYVLKQPMEMSEQQVGQFLKLVGRNARPVQPLNGRQVEVRDATPTRTSSN